MGQEKKRNRKAHGRTQVFWFLALALGLALPYGCVRTVYLPYTASQYKEQLDKCMKNKRLAEKDLIDCLDAGEDLRHYYYNK